MKYISLSVFTSKGHKNDITCTLTRAVLLKFQVDFLKLKQLQLVNCVGIIAFNTVAKILLISQNDAKV